MLIPWVRRGYNSDVRCRWRNGVQGSRDVRVCGRTPHVDSAADCINDKVGGNHQVKSCNKWRWRI